MRSLFFTCTLSVTTDMRCVFGCGQVKVKKEPNSIQQNHQNVIQQNPISQSQQNVVQQLHTNPVPKQEPNPIQQNYGETFVHLGAGIYKAKHKADIPRNESIKQQCEERSAEHHLFSSVCSFLLNS